MANRIVPQCGGTPLSRRRVGLFTPHQPTRQAPSELAAAKRDRMDVVILRARVDAALKPGR